MASNSLTDWNDLHVNAGINEVKSQLMAAIKLPAANDSPPTPPPIAGAAQPLMGDEQPWTARFQTHLLKVCWVTAALVTAL